MPEDGRLYVTGRHPQRAVALAQGREQARADAGENGPVFGEGVDVPVGDAAMQMRLDVLQILRLSAVNVAGQVEVEIVFGIADLRQRHHAGIARDFGLSGEGVHDLVDVLFAKPVLIAVLDEPFGGVDEEDAFAGGGVLFVQHDDAGGDAGAVEEVGWKADDCFDQAAGEQVLADDGLRVAAKKDAMRKNARSFAGGLERADDVQEIGVVALFGGRDAVRIEAVERVVVGIESGAPAFVGKGRVGDDVVEGLEGVAVFEEGVGEGVALFDFGFGMVVEDHVHVGQTGGGGVFFLTVEGDLHVPAVAGLVADFEQERTGAAGGVVDGGVAGDGGVPDAEDAGHDARDFGGGVELALALAAFGGEVAHEVLVGVAQNIVPIGAVFGEVEGGIFKDGDEVGEAVHHFLAGAQLCGVVEVRHVGEPVLLRERAKDAFVDLVTNVGLALEGDHVLEAGSFRDGDERVVAAGVLVADVFDEEEHEHVVLVLAGVHASAEFVTGGPEGGIEFGFFDGHRGERGMWGEVSESDV